MSQKPLIAFHEVTARYGSVTALNKVSLHINSGEIVALIGANGAGKSTLLMSLFGNPGISSGSIEFNGSPIHTLPPHEIARLGISLAPEGRRVFPKMTVAENLELGLKQSQLKKPKPELDKMYSLFPILNERRKQQAGTLSGGEQQQLAMARALVSNPTLFLVDEPSLGLAPQITHALFEILKNIHQFGTTVFLVEQNAHAALTLAERAYVLTNGEITMEGKGLELLNNEAIKKAYLGK